MKPNDLSKEGYGFEPKAVKTLYVLVSLLVNKKSVALQHFPTVPVISGIVFFTLFKESASVETFKIKTETLPFILDYCLEPRLQENYQCFS